MSLILEALQRSDQERVARDSVPGIHTPQPVMESGGGAIRWLLSLGLFLLLGGGLAWYLFSAPQLEEQQASAMPEPVATQATAPAPTAAPVEPPATVPREAVVVVPMVNQALGEAEVAALYSQVSEDLREEAPPAPRPTAQEPADAAALPVDALVAAAQQELSSLQDQPVASAEPALPMVQELPQRIRDEIPSIFFSNHDWSGDAARRQVTLNGEVRREGDAVVAGVRLLEIRRDDIVLDYRGNLFRLRALNSWVNL